MKSYRYHGLVLLAGISWSTLAVFSKLLSELGVDVFNQVFWRLILCTLLTYVTARIAHIPAPLSRKQIVPLVINALIIILAWITIAAAIFLGTPIAKAIVLSYAYPVSVIILTYLLLHESPSRKHILAMVLSIVSLGFLLEIWTVTSLARLQPGDIYAWTNSVAFAGMIVWGTKLRRTSSMHPVATLMYTCLFALPMYLLVSVFFSLSGFSLLLPQITTGFSAAAWGSLLGLSLFATVIPMTLMYAGAKHIKPFVTSILLLTEPIGVYIWGLTLFGQQLSLWSIIGAIGILIASALT